MIGPLLVLAGLGAIGVGCWKLRPAYHVYRGDTDDVVTVERDEGPVELEGTASIADETLSAPLTNRECLAYEYEVEEYQSSGKHSSWNTVETGSGAVQFRLEDETASVQVDPGGTTLALTTTTTVEVDGGEPEPDPIKAFLETESDLDSENTALDLRVVEIATGNDRRYHERRLEAGDDVYVLGQSRYDIDARETMRDVSAVIEDGPGTPAFVISDSSQDGAAWLLVKPVLPWLAGGLVMSLLGGWLAASTVLF